MCFKLFNLPSYSMTMTRISTLIRKSDVAPLKIYIFEWGIHILHHEVEGVWKIIDDGGGGW